MPSGPIFSIKLICPRHPSLIKEVIRWLAAYQLHGNFTPGRISTYRLLSLPVTASHRKVLITLGLWLDRSIIIPTACHRHTGSCPVLIADCSRSVSDRTDLEPYNQSGGVPAVVCLEHHGAIANVAYAHHKSNRKVSDEWVFGCQGTADLSKERPLTLFAVE